MSDERFQEEHDRILNAWRERNPGFSGAFYLIYNVDSMKGATRVKEAKFEKEFRTRMDGDQNPRAELVILPA